MTCTLSSVIIDPKLSFQREEVLLEQEFESIWRPMFRGGPIAILFEIWCRTL